MPLCDFPRPSSCLSSPPLLTACHLRWSDVIYNYIFLVVVFVFLPHFWSSAVVLAAWSSLVSACSLERGKGGGGGDQTPCSPKPGKLRTSHEQITHRRQGAPIWRWVPCRTDISGGVGLLRADATEYPASVEAGNPRRGTNTTSKHAWWRGSQSFAHQTISWDFGKRCTMLHINQTTVIIFSELFDPPPKMI